MVAEKSYSLPSITIGKDWKTSLGLGEVQLLLNNFQTKLGLVLLGPVGVMVVHLQSGWGAGVSGWGVGVVSHSDSVTVFSVVVTIFAGEGLHSSVVVEEHSSLVPPVQSCNKEMALDAHQRFLLLPIQQFLVLHLDEQRQETLVL
jgi:hypothetical protein